MVRVRFPSGLFFSPHTQNFCCCCRLIGAEIFDVFSAKPLAGGYNMAIRSSFFLKKRLRHISMHYLTNNWNPKSFFEVQKIGTGSKLENNPFSLKIQTCVFKKPLTSFFNLVSLQHKVQSQHKTFTKWALSHGLDSHPNVFDRNSPVGHRKIFGS